MHEPHYMNPAPNRHGSSVRGLVLAVAVTCLTSLLLSGCAAIAQAAWNVLEVSEPGGLARQKQRKATVREMEHRHELSVQRMDPEYQAEHRFRKFIDETRDAKFFGSSSSLHLTEFSLLVESKDQSSVYEEIDQFLESYSLKKSSGEDATTKRTYRHGAVKVEIQSAPLSDADYRYLRIDGGRKPLRESLAKVAVKFDYPSGRQTP